MLHVEHFGFEVGFLAGILRMLQYEFDGTGELFYVEQFAI